MFQTYDFVGTENNFLHILIDRKIFSIDFA